LTGHSDKNKTKQNKTKQNKTKQNKTKQNKTKQNRESMKLTDIMNQMDLTDIYRMFHPNRKKKNLFFSVPHGSFSKIGHIIGDKARLQRHKKI
jgi:exonuclease III